MSDREITPVPCKHCGCTAVKPENFNSFTYMACQCAACGVQGPLRPVLSVFGNRPLELLCIQDWNNLFSPPSADWNALCQALGERSDVADGSAASAILTQLEDIRDTLWHIKSPERIETLAKRFTTIGKRMPAEFMPAYGEYLLDLTNEFQELCNEWLDWHKAVGESETTPAKAPIEPAASQSGRTSRAAEMAAKLNGWPEGRKMPEPETQQVPEPSDDGEGEGAGLDDDPEAAKHTEEAQHLRAEIKAWISEHHITAKAGAGYIGISAERMYRFLNGSRWTTPQTLKSIREGFTRALAKGIEKKAQPEEEPDPADRDAFVRYHLVRWMEGLGYSLDEAAMHLWMNNAEIQDVVDGKPVDEEILPRLCAAIRPLRIHADQLGTGKGVNGSGTG